MRGRFDWKRAAGIFLALIAAVAIARWPETGGHGASDAAARPLARGETAKEAGSPPVESLPSRAAPAEHRFAPGASAYSPEAAASGVVVHWNQEPIAWRRISLECRSGERILSDSPGSVRVPPELRAAVNSAIVDEFLATRGEKRESSDARIPLMLEPGCLVSAVDGETGSVLPDASIELSLVDAAGERVRCVGAPLLLPAVSRAKRFVLRAPGYRSKEVFVEPEDDRREVALSRGTPARFKVRCPSRHRRILVLQGDDVVESCTLARGSEGVVLALPAGNFIALLEARSSPLHDWRIADTESLGVSEGSVTPEIVTLVEEREDARLVCELRPPSSGPSGEVHLVLENEHGIEVDRKRITAERLADPESRLVSFRAVSAGAYRVRVLPHLTEREVVLESGQERVLALGWSEDRRLEVYVLDSVDSTPIEDANVSIVLPRGSGPWKLGRSSDSDPYRFATSLPSVRVRAAANGYESKTEGLDLAFGVTAAIVELEPVESSWIRLQILNGGDAVLLTPRELADHLSVSTPDGEEVRLVNIKARGHLPGRFRECRVEFRYEGAVLVDFDDEERGRTKIADVTLVAGETRDVRLELDASLVPR